MRGNPVSYAVDGLRHALYGGHVPASLALGGPGTAGQLGLVLAFAVATTGLAAWTCSRRT